jgi:hypothetical protein
VNDYRITKTLKFKLNLIIVFEVAVSIHEHSSAPIRNGKVNSFTKELSKTKLPPRQEQIISPVVIITIRPHILPPPEPTND